MYLLNWLTTCKLTIVIENPIQFTMVSAVPLDSVNADCAIKVENCGESATTAMPHTIITTAKTRNGI
jgi:hypothetical protein